MKKMLPFPALLLLASPAFAHTGNAVHADGISFVQSMLNGLIHPLTGADHLLAMLAAGLCASAFSGKKRFALPMAFLLMMLAGFSMALSGIALPAVEGVILASVVVLGAFTLMTPGLGVTLLVASAFAVFHGHAHGAEIGHAGGLAFGAGFLASSSLLLATGLRIGSSIRSRLPGFLSASR